MSHPDLDPILDDLKAHAGVFDLDRNDLGGRALEIAVNGVKDHFDGEVDPDGKPWPKLSTDYSRWKGRHFPGEPMGVLHGLMRSEIDGETSVTTDSAEWTNGRSEEGRKESTWFQEGDAVANRPERRFADLNAESIGRSDQLFDTHFDEATGP